MSTDAPALTVVLAGLADAAVLETTLLHLRAQTVRDEIEVIVVDFLASSGSVRSR